jgi:hypothetical protein
VPESADSGITSPFAYTVLRVVPDVERGERVNVGVVLFCRQRGFLGVRIHVDRARLRALAPGLAIHEVEGHLRGLSRVAEGADDAGPIAALSQSERFGWLSAPASTIVQPSEAHTGLCQDPATTLDNLFKRLVEGPAVA